MKKLYILLIALFVSNGATAQWVPLNSGTTKNLRSVFFTDANTGYVVGDSGTILKTINAGTTWSALTSGTAYNFHAVHFPDANTGYAVGTGLNVMTYVGIVLKTIDGGTTWSASFYDCDFIYFLSSVFFTDSNTGYTLGTCTTYSGMAIPEIRKTTNGGTSWISLSLGTFCPFPLFCGLSSVFFTEADTGYVVGSDSTGSQGMILKTIDGGQTWTNYSLTSTRHFNSVNFPDANTGYVVGDGGTILKTINAGTTWSALMSGTTSSLVTVFFPDVNNGYALADTVSNPLGIILKTIDGGTTWTTLSSGTAIHLNSVYFTDANTGYLAGDNGTILKTKTGGISGTNDLSPLSNALKIYPNPTSNSITIETRTKGSLTISNCSIQQILQREITEPTITIDVSKLPSGVYVVRLTSDNGVTMGKIIKQ